MNISPKIQAMAASWARSFIGAGLAVCMTGNTNPSDIVKAGVAAVLPVLLRWVNSNDAAFGRGSK